MLSYALFVPILTLVIVILAVRGRGALKAVKNSDYFKAFLSIGMLATLLCALFGYLGYRYNNNNSHCSTDPYAVTITITGVAGGAALIAALVLAIRSKQKMLSYLTIACIINLVIAASSAWFIAELCFVF